MGQGIINKVEAILKKQFNPNTQEFNEDQSNHFSKLKKYKEDQDGHGRRNEN